jgi:hypothetical protein
MIIKMIRDRGREVCFSLNDPIGKFVSTRPRLADFFWRSFGFELNRRDFLNAQILRDAPAHAKDLSVRYECALML